jgi:serine protease Do
LESEISQLGLSLHQLTPELADRYGYETVKGVLISHVEGGSAAYRAGLKSGDLILQINRQAVSTVEEARKQLQNGVEKVILLLVRRGDSALYVALKVE